MDKISDGKLQIDGEPLLGAITWFGGISEL